jgi:hypothetical protein
MKTSFIIYESLSQIDNDSFSRAIRKLLNPLAHGRPYRRRPLSAARRPPHRRHRRDGTARDRPGIARRGARDRPGAAQRGGARSAGTARAWCHAPGRRTPEHGHDVEVRCKLAVHTVLTPLTPARYSPSTQFIQRNIVQLSETLGPGTAGPPPGGMGRIERGGSRCRTLSSVTCPNHRSASPAPHPDGIRPDHGA